MTRRVFRQSSLFSIAMIALMALPDGLVEAASKQRRSATRSTRSGPVRSSPAKSQRSRNVSTRAPRSVSRTKGSGVRSQRPSIARPSASNAPSRLRSGASSIRRASPPRSGKGAAPSRSAAPTLAPSIRRSVPRPGTVETGVKSNSGRVGQARGADAVRGTRGIRQTRSLRSDGPTSHVRSVERVPWTGASRPRPQAAPADPRHASDMPADRRSGFITRRPGSSPGVSIGIDRNRFAGSVSIRPDGDSVRVGGAVAIRPERDHHGSRGRRDEHRHGRFGRYDRPYPYAPTYPYIYPYRPAPIYGYPYRPFRREIYPWRSDSYYFGLHGRRDHHHRGRSRYLRTYYPSCGYAPFYHSYVSIYYDTPHVYRYHDVYTYHDAGGSTYDTDGATYDARSDEYDSYEAADSSAQAIDATVSSDAFEYSEAAPIEWSFDPPDGVGPPLDWSGERTPLPGEPSSALRDGLKAFRMAEFSTARSAFVRAMLMDERDAYAKFLYGLASFAQGDYAVAALSWRRAALADELFLHRPPDVRFLYEMPELFEAQLDLLSRIAVDRLDDRDVRFSLAYVFYATGEPALAGELFRRLAESDPTDELSARFSQACANAAEWLSPDDVAVGAP